MTRKVQVAVERVVTLPSGAVAGLRVDELAVRILRVAEAWDARDPVVRGSMVAYAMMSAYAAAHGDSGTPPDALVAEVVNAAAATMRELVATAKAWAMSEILRPNDPPGEA